MKYELQRVKNIYSLDYCSSTIVYFAFNHQQHNDHGEHFCNCNLNNAAHIIAVFDHVFSL